MEGIVNEFEEEIYSASSKKIINVAHLPERTYWVAIINDQVIGTIGLVKLQNASIALKSMMLDKAFRSDKREIAKMLLQTVIDWALEQNITCIYLGTMDQFKSAQKFYEKHAFTRIDDSELPADFPANPVDVVFYKRSLKYSL